jgi:hypothetical protein
MRKRSRPENAVLRSWVEGQIYVGIDSFRYVEELNKLPGMPDLTAMLIMF